MAPRGPGYRSSMKLMRGIAAAGLAKTVYDQAKKPQNQAKIKAAVAKARARSTRAK